MVELRFTPFPVLKTKRLLLRKLLENTGFVKEGPLRESFYFKGEFEDTLIYSRLK